LEDLAEGAVRLRGYSSRDAPDVGEARSIIQAEKEALDEQLSLGDEAAHHAVGALYRPDLDPVGTAFARKVRAGEPFGYDPFEPPGGRLLEEGDAGADHALRENEGPSGNASLP